MPSDCRAVLSKALSQESAVGYTSGGAGTDRTRSLHFDFHILRDLDLPATLEPPSRLAKSMHDSDGNGENDPKLSSSVDLARGRFTRPTSL